ncbi:tetratricopeptide repeat protein [Lewinella sp. 4G2]|uniref:tetratricopeptide repeat protein n=1 Tax=Lewinella sp. 4G2 TaxID=1803372 RepID=UPI0007B4F63A|nr:tetratricopeptide repeat protein [Lewinella sp. 4G2]OAV45379.1 hypothetical protein A3850_013145 [Lewinella sp. 4G2]
MNYRLPKVTRALLAGLIGTLLFANAPLSGQATTVYTEAWRTFKKAEADQSEDLLAKAQREYEEVIEMLLPIQTPEAELLRTKAELNRAKIAVRLGKVEGEKLILDFVRRYQPDPIANEALLEIANYYFNEGDLKKATDYYKRVPADLLSVEQRAELNFRLGYTNFVQKKFGEAKRYFQFSKSDPGEFYYPTNYYLGMIYFFEGNYDQAISQFSIAEKDRKYKAYIPYYLTQIYFAQKRYDELIEYAAPKVGSRAVRNTKEMSQLLGQAYFEKGDYTRARPLLEAYARGNRRMQEEELYQLGFTQYKLQAYQNAQESFKDLAGQNSLPGQSANYYLGDIYLRQGNGPAARNAFGAASRMNFDPNIKEEALFNYAKLSYELGFSQDAMAAIKSLPTTSKYYVQGQELMGKIFSSSQDFAGALEVLEKIPNRTPQLQEAYQRAAFGQGMVLLRKGDVAGAKVLLDRSLEQPIDSKLRAQATYWKADIEHMAGNYPQSIALTNQFLALATGMQNLPDQASVHTGNYLQGYNYLKQNNYRASVDYFVKTVQGIERNINYISDRDVRERVLGDAVLRAGDGYFSQNNYNQAGVYYDDAITRKTNGFVYAIFQKGMIEGLTGQPARKILAMEELVQRYPTNAYADDALYQAAITYVELNQPQQALPPLRRIVSDFRGKSLLVNQSLLQLGLISFNLGNTEAAINYYKQVFTSNPTPEESEVAKKALEEIYVKKMGRSDLYFDFLSTIPGQELDADGRESIVYEAAVSQYENGNYERAIPALTDYLRQYPRSTNALSATYFRGDSYLNQRLYAEALGDYEAVIAAGPSAYYVSSLKKGSLIAYNSLRDFTKSYRLFTQLEQAAEDQEVKVDAQIGALRAAYRLNDIQATETYARKVSQNPIAPSEQRTTANFYLGKIAYDRQDFNAARQAFATVIENSDDEQTAEARYLVANSYYLGGDLDKAEELASNANTESSGHQYWVAKSFILWSDVLRKKNDPGTAVAVLEALLNTYSADPDLVAEARTKLAAAKAEQQGSSRINDPSKTTRPGYLEMDDSNN